jgi:hypothetical protein
MDDSGGGMVVRRRRGRRVRLRRCPGCGLRLHPAFFEANRDYCMECNRGEDRGLNFQIKAHAAQALARAALDRAAAAHPQKGKQEQRD